MRALFFIWGAVGLFANFISAGNLFTSTSVGVGTSTYVCAMALIWIGGMLFFGLGSMLWGEHLKAENDPVATRIKSEKSSKNWREVSVGLFLIAAMWFFFTALLSHT